MYWHPTPVLLPGKSHGRRSLVGCSPWGRKESGTTERLHFHFSLSCIGEGNGNPLQCSCLENPRDGGVWWAAVYGVAQSWTRLKWLSSSSSSSSSDVLTMNTSDSQYSLYCKYLPDFGEITEGFWDSCFLSFLSVNKFIWKQKWLSQTYYQCLNKLFVSFVQKNFG